jgi:hypothetical protein
MLQPNNPDIERSYLPEETKVFDPISIQPIQYLDQKKFKDATLDCTDEINPRN